MPRQQSKNRRLQKRMAQLRADRPLYLAVAAALTLVWVILNASLVVPR